MPIPLKLDGKPADTSRVKTGRTSPRSRTAAISSKALMLLSALALIAGAQTGLAGSAQAEPASPEPATVQSRIASSAEFSMPDYLPLRANAEVGCVKTNCKENGTYKHGYWAIDFVGSAPSQPVFAAGRGYFHLETKGNQVCGSRDGWIDHGGGWISRYVHLSNISVAEGQHVTEDTQIGVMGACHDEALHFSVKQNGRGGGVKNAPSPGELRACISGRQLTYPAALGLKSWDDVTPFKSVVASQGTSCWAAPARAGNPTNAKFKFNKKKRANIVKWSAPAANPQLVTGYVVGSRHQARSTGKWTIWHYKYLPASTRKTATYDGWSPTKFEVTLTAMDSGGANQLPTISARRR